MNLNNFYCALTKTYMICFWGIKTLNKQVKTFGFGEFYKNIGN